jgi:hypothetical protein
MRDGDVSLEDDCVLVRRAARKGVEGTYQDQEAPARLSLRARSLQALCEQLLARESSRAVFPSPRSDSVWNSDNFCADVFAKAVERVAAKARGSARSRARRRARVAERRDEALRLTAREPVVWEVRERLTTEERERFAELLGPQRRSGLVCLGGHALEAANIELVLGSKPQQIPPRTRLDPLGSEPLRNAEKCRRAPSAPERIKSSAIDVPHSRNENWTGMCN